MKITKPKHMSVKEFADTGLLQEVNRQFFHPRGLALEIEVLCEPEFAEMAPENVPPDKMLYRLSGIQDFREDPEGIVYGKPNPTLTKAIYAQKLLSDHVDVREQKYGWMIQPINKEVDVGE